MLQYMNIQKNAKKTSAILKMLNGTEKLYILILYKYEYI